MPAFQTSLSDSFSPGVRERGKAYYFDKRVKIQANDDSDVVIAEVRGGRAYRVSLRRVGRILRVSCTCPFFESEAEPCKHVWATMLEAGARKRFRHGQLDRIGIDPTVQTLAPSPSARPARQTREKTSKSWQRQLRQLETDGARPESSPLGESSEIIYVLDIDATQTGGALVLEVAFRRQRRDGEWGTTRPFTIRLNQIRLLPQRADQEILAILSSSREPGTSRSAPSWEATLARHRLAWPVPEVVLPMIAATGRLWLRVGDRQYVQGIRWEGSEPWEFVVVVESRKAEHSYELQGGLQRNGNRIPLSAPLLLLEGGLVITDESIAPLLDHGAFSWISLLRKEGRLLVPHAERERLRSTLMAIPTRPPLELPDELRWDEVSIEPRPHLRIGPRRSRSESYEPLLAQLSFDYDDMIVDAGHPDEMVVIEQGARLLRRRRSTETAFEQRLESLGFRSTWSPGRFRMHPARLGQAVRALLAEQWSVETEEGSYRAASDLEMRMESGIDWFDLEGSARFDEMSIPLPALLEALRRKESFIRLQDGSIGIVPEEWLENIAPLVALAKQQGGVYRFRRNQLGLLDVLLASRPEIRCDEVLQKARSRLSSFAGIAPREPSRGFRGTLRPYQKEGLGWLEFLREFGFGGCLADDMGLGKTVQVLALLESLRESGKHRPSLVVVPRSLLFNWRSEAQRFTPQLEVLDYSGTDRKAYRDRFHEFDLVLTTYGTLRRDILHFREIEFDTVILDEAQAIKNASTQAAKAVRVLQTRHRLALSGTPIENHVGELWSLFEFLNPGMLGGPTIFRRLASAAGPGDPATEDLLRRSLRPFILRRTKAQVARDLPEKTEQTIHCDLEPKQRKLYDELRDHYRESLLQKVDRDGIRKSKIQVLEALLRLRQAACHPALIDPNRSSQASGKLEVLIPELQVVLEEGHKALVFSQFTSFLSLLRDRLDALGIDYGYLDGKSRDRKSEVDRFQNDPDRRLFLISLKAGGLGLNLTAAEYVFLLDPWWNPAVESQAIDRAHRIGQTRRVFAYRLIARDTVEEKILELQKSKRKLAEAILTEDQSVIRQLTSEDLELLLS